MYYEQFFLFFMDDTRNMAQTLLLAVCHAINLLIRAYTAVEFYTMTGEANIVFDLLLIGNCSY